MFLLHVLRIAALRIVVVQKGPVPVLLRQFQGSLPQLVGDLSPLVVLADGVGPGAEDTVKVSGEDIIVKETKTAAGDRYVYFSLEMESLLREFQRECAWETETYDGRELEDADYIFRRHGYRLPMTPSTFTWRFKLILKKHGLPTALNVHSLRHTTASLLIAGGADVATVAGLLGHSQPSTTLDIYTHAFDKNKKAASQALHEGLEI